MKIAIRGHKSRGKEVIQILESLGGRNVEALTGTYESFYYIDVKNEIGDDHKKNFPSNYKLYTLEEFEKEFPFKVEDKVIDYEGDVATITGFVYIEENLGYSLQYENGTGKATPRLLKFYKEMKAERIVTITLEKAKEWYNKGGELKEIALQAFTEKELNPLPRSWEEFATNHARMGYYISSDGKPLMCAASGKLSSPHVCPSKESAKAHLAMIQLEQLRDYWRQGWVPDYTKTYKKFRIKKLGTEYVVDWSTGLSDFLVFETEEIAKEFLNCFRDLIKTAEDLI